MGNTVLNENVDYIRTDLIGNTDPGTATIIFEALTGNASGYVGTKTLTFRIVQKKVEYKGALIGGGWK